MTTTTTTTTTIVYVVTHIRRERTLCEP